MPTDTCQVSPAMPAGILCKGIPCKDQVAGVLLLDQHRLMSSDIKLLVEQSGTPTSSAVIFQNPATPQQYQVYPYPYAPQQYYGYSPCPPSQYPYMGPMYPYGHQAPPPPPPYYPPPIFAPPVIPPMPPHVQGQGQAPLQPHYQFPASQPVTIPMPPLKILNQGHYQFTQSVLLASHLPPMTINPFPPPQATLTYLSSDSQSQPQIPTTNLQVTPSTTSSAISIQSVALQQSVVQASPMPPAPQTTTQESLQLTSVTTASSSTSEGPLKATPLLSPQQQIFGTNGSYYLEFIDGAAAQVPSVSHSAPPAAIVALMAITTG